MATALNEKVDLYIKQNELTLQWIAQHRDMTLKELEKAYWADEAVARREVDRILISKGAKPLEWKWVMNAQLMLLNMQQYMK